MAIYGVGAFYQHDVSQDFIDQNVVGVGWTTDVAPELQEYFKSLKAGNIVYLKAAFGGKPITVKGIGIITDNEILEGTPLVSTGRNVKWLSTEQFKIAKPQEKNNVRSNTVYEEFHPAVIKEIIARIN